MTQLAAYLAPELTAKHMRMWGPVSDSLMCRPLRRLHEMANYEGPVLVGPTPGVRLALDHRDKLGLPWIYWDRGYFARFPEVPDPLGYHRLTLNAFQQNWVQPHREPARLISIVANWGLNFLPWQRNPDGHILLCAPSDAYTAFHGLGDWVGQTREALGKLTDHRIVMRWKGDRLPLEAALKGCYAVVAHGSNVAVEAAIRGAPVFVHSSSAAAPIGKTSIEDILRPAFPDRQEWLISLAHGQFTIAEMVEGEVWARILEPLQKSSRSSSPAESLVLE